MKVSFWYNKSGEEGACLAQVSCPPSAPDGSQELKPYSWNEFSGNESTIWDPNSVSLHVTMEGESLSPEVQDTVTTLLGVLPISAQQKQGCTFIPKIAPWTLLSAKGITAPCASTSPAHCSKQPTIPIKASLTHNSFTEPFKAREVDEGTYRISCLTSKRKRTTITPKRCQVILCKVNWVAN